VALALWLPRYMIGVYGLDLKTAGVLATTFSLSASLFRAYGGVLADRYGARRIMYASFGVSLLVLFMLSYPATDYTIHGIKGPITFSTSMGLAPFVVALFVLIFMALGMAAVFKHIPVYYPDHVGAVGGLVGMVGGLGGFVLPIVFGAISDLTGIWTSCFAVLFALVAVALGWMHLAIRQMERKAGGIERRPAPIARNDRAARSNPPWRPCAKGAGRLASRGPAFLETTGERCAAQFDDFHPGLLLAFAVWMVWSVVVAKLPLIGFDYTTDQLFWLAALPGLSGATLRIFYSFMVPIFGGRLWTTLSTASLLIPAFGIGYAVQNPGTPYFIFLVLALLCGFGGGNFASSMANIGFFFPKARKGNARPLMAGWAIWACRRCSSLCRWSSPAGSSAPLAESRNGPARARICGCKMRALSGCHSSSPPACCHGLA
jgi:NNP family nitrate/nitrite transporter-like MFS transporter